MRLPRGTWLGGAWTGSLCLCYARPLAGKRNRGISSSRRRSKPKLWKLGEERDEKEKPATERRRECTDFESDVGEREKQVICHASALALAMTDKACREAEMTIFITFMSGSKSLVFH